MEGSNYEASAAEHINAMLHSDKENAILSPEASKRGLPEHAFENHDIEFEDPETTKNVFQSLYAKVDTAETVGMNQ